MSDKKSTWKWNTRQKKARNEKIQMFGISLLRNIIPVTNDKEKKYSNTMLLFFANRPPGPLIKSDKKYKMKLNTKFDSF